MILLPYDIWLHIASFLDKDTVQYLSSVNSPLFNIALDNRYRKACFGICTANAGLDKHMKCAPIRDTFSALRVRHLVIHEGSPHGLRKEMTVHKHKTTYRHFMEAIKASWTRPFSHNHVESQAIGVKVSNHAQNLKELVSNLTSVTTLEIILPQHEEPTLYSSKFAILDSGWPIFGSSLTNFIIKSTLEDIALILRPPTKLVQLQTFKIQVLPIFRFEIQVLSVYPASGRTSLLKENLIPFLDTHHDVLQSLTLECVEDLDISSLLASLPYVPSLSGFRLAQIFQNSRGIDLSGHAHFLNTHRHHLQHLDLKFLPVSSISPTPEEWFSEEFNQISFPRLKSLTLQLPRLSDYVPEEAILYLHRYFPILTSLDFHRFLFTYEDAVLLFSIPEHGLSLPMGHRLRNLHLHVSSLTTNLLRFFALNLPYLHSLSLQAEFVTDFNVVDLYYENVNGVYRAIPRIAFPDWNLHSLRITPFNYHPEARLTFYVRALLAILPKLQYLCGLEREELLTSPLGPLFN